MEVTFYDDRHLVNLKSIIPVMEWCLYRISTKFTQHSFTTNDGADRKKNITKKKLMCVAEANGRIYVMR